MSGGIYMLQPIINKKMTRQSKEVKNAQKASKKYFNSKGDSKVKITKPAAGKWKTRMEKFVDLKQVTEISVTGNDDTAKVYKIDTAKDLIMACDECQLTGCSGNGFPVSKKLEKIKKGKCRLIINAIECDPGLVHDSWIYRNYLDKVETGVKLLNRIFSFEDIVLATREPVTSKKYSFRQLKMINRFPMGYEKYLIMSVYGKEILPEETPIEHGMVVMNLQTVLKIGELETGIVPGIRYITVADIKHGIAKAVKAQNGQNIKEIAKKVFPNEKSKIYYGAGALSCNEASSDTMLDNTTSFIGLGNMPSYKDAGKCVGCGKCSKVCPAGVSVKELIRFNETDKEMNKDNYKKFHTERCVYCGACSYYCSAGKDTRGVVAWIKNA